MTDQSPRLTWAESEALRKIHVAVKERIQKGQRLHQVAVPLKIGAYGMWWVGTTSVGIGHRARVFHQLRAKGLIALQYTSGTGLIWAFLNTKEN